MHTPGHELAKQTIAEQMETEEVLICLKKWEWFLRGYLLHKPAPLLVD